MESGAARTNAAGLVGTAWLAYYCCGVRAEDAARREPICGDRFAELFMDDQGQALFNKFAGLKLANAAIATRGRIIDGWLSDRILAEPDVTIILLGAGFDARAFRLPGGQWLELDDPALIAIKNEVLPPERSPNPLQRSGIDFARERLEDRLDAIAAEHPVIVMEGVSMYLSPVRFRATLTVLRRAFPRHTLICDLMSRRFAERYCKDLRQRLTEMDSDFAELADDPADAVAAAGYRCLSRVPMMVRARELGASPVPLLLLNTLLRDLRDGYAAHVFETVGRRL